MDMFWFGFLFGFAMLSGWAQRREWLYLKAEREWREEYMRQLRENMAARLREIREGKGGSAGDAE